MGVETRVFETSGGKRYVHLDKKSEWDAARLWLALQSFERPVILRDDDEHYDEWSKTHERWDPLEEEWNEYLMADYAHSLARGASVLTGEILKAQWRWDAFERRKAMRDA